LLDRIPTRVNLATRRILPTDAPESCVFCNNVAPETVNHLFLQCEAVCLIWYNVMTWIGFNFITPQNMFVHFECWSSEGNNNKFLKGLWLIWHATIWVIWNVRNKRIFSNEIQGVNDLVEEIKVLFNQGCQNRDFTSGRKGIAKSRLVKSQSKSKDFTQGLL
jgi:hypothetical protein